MMQPIKCLLIDKDLKSVATLIFPGDHGEQRPTVLTYKNRMYVCLCHTMVYMLSDCWNGDAFAVDQAKVDHGKAGFVVWYANHPLCKGTGTYLVVAPASPLARTPQTTSVLDSATIFPQYQLAAMALGLSPTVGEANLPGVILAVKWHAGHWQVVNTKEAT